MIVDNLMSCSDSGVLKRAIQHINEQ